MKRKILALAAAGVLLAGCADANQDRSGGGGKDPDQFAARHPWEPALLPIAGGTSNRE